MTKHRSIYSSMEDESIGQCVQRARNGGGRKPLRSLRELAEEFGVTSQKLAAQIALYAGPKSKFSTGSGKNGAGRNTWYDPAEVRAWWKKLAQN